MGVLDLQELAGDLEQYTRPDVDVDGKVCCHACERWAPQKEMNRCGRCKQFYYCSKVQHTNCSQMHVFFADISRTAN